VRETEEGYGDTNTQRSRKRDRSMYVYRRTSIYQGRSGCQARRYSLWTLPRAIVNLGDHDGADAAQ
jgi:hypothetical protein